LTCLQAFIALRVIYTTVQGLKLHLDMFGQNFSCPEVSTPQGPELQMYMSTLERPVLLLEVSTPQHRGLSCTWTCLGNSSLCSNVPELNLDLSALQSPLQHLDRLPLKGLELNLVLSTLKEVFPLQGP
jgi:hypothetical protein